MTPSDTFLLDEANGFKILPEPIAPIADETPSLPRESLPLKSVPSDETQPQTQDLDLGELPASYGSGELYLIGGDPRWLFAYWDFDWSKAEPPKEELTLRLFRTDDRMMSEQPVMRGDVSWLMQNPQAGATFYVEIGWVGPSQIWNPLVRSGLAETVSSTASNDESATFAAIPFHITFERLRALLEIAAIEGESLAETISRLQRDSGSDDFLRRAAASWSEEQRRILDALIGQEVLERFELDSLEIERLLRRSVQSLTAKEDSLFSRERWDHILRLSMSSTDLAGS